MNIGHSHPKVVAAIKEQAVNVKPIGKYENIRSTNLRSTIINIMNYAHCDLPFKWKAIRGCF